MDGRDDGQQRAPATHEAVPEDGGFRRRRTITMSRSVGRPSKAQPFRQFVSDLLTREPEVTSAEILRRATGAGYQGRKSALYDVIATLRPPTPGPMPSYDGLPGELSYHQRGRAKVRFGDGSSREIQFLVSRLRYSRWTDASVLRDSSAGAVAIAMVTHFTRMGGIPLLAVVSDADAAENGQIQPAAELSASPLMARAALALGLGVDREAPAWAGPAPESLTELLRTSFLQQRPFRDVYELEQQLARWVAQNNASAYNGRAAPFSLLPEEQQRLRPVRLTPEQATELVRAP